jgi:hypothetical protein
MKMGSKIGGNLDLGTTGNAMSGLMGGMPLGI